MDFFQEQERARSNTKLLVMLFALAVLLIIAAIYMVALIAFHTNQELQQSANRYWQPETFFWVSGLVLLIVSSGSLYKISQLAKNGGTTIAIALGGTFVSRETNDPLEKRLLNVVDEMAIASGVSVPRVFVLKQETAINAFAAGDKPSNAVIAVTRGCLEKLNRDELQGVVAHEFSHIFNGDMRLNLRLMGVLHGILLIAMIGRLIMRVRHSGRRSDGKAQAFSVLLGAALFVIGYIGVFFGNLIKAAVSRQREFLADAAAVQFTRNPDGLAGALKKISGVGSTSIQNPAAEQASHMFFGQAINGLFATHPPIGERIARIEPTFRKLQTQSSQNSAATSSLPAGAMGFAATDNTLRDSVGTVDQAHLAYAQQLLTGLPEEVIQALHKPAQTAAIIYALLVAEEAEPDQVLAKCLGSSGQATLQVYALRYLPWLKQSSRAYWLPLIELALPALRELPQSEQLEVMACTEALVKADGKINLFEFAILALVDYQLGNKTRTKRGKATSPGKIQQDINLLLSMMAYIGKNSQAEASLSFAAATKLAPMDGQWDLIQPKAINLHELGKLLNNLNQLSYGFKAKIIEASTAAVLANGKITLVEAELLRAISARLECPVPPLIADA